MSMPPDLLLRTPEEAVRRIALALLDEARAASVRLDDPEDEENLHDFRVAIRRLRSTLRAWKDELKGSVKGRHRRALKGLQNATGAGRDAEVAVAWLETLREDLEDIHRPGFDWSITRLEDRYRGAMDHVCEDVRAAFHEIEDDLRGAIGVMHVETHLDRTTRAPTYAAALAGKVREHAEELVRHLLLVGSVDDEEEVHEARITGKRLRYLVEPVRPFAPQAVTLVKRMKRVQDVLGDLHDCYVQRPDFEESRVFVAEASDLEASEALGAGLDEILRRVRSRGEGLYEALHEGWLENGVQEVVLAAEALANELERIAHGDVEIERKYLLRSLPVLPKGARAVEIDQGWLPGDRLRERLRRKASPKKTVYLRTIKLGEGIQRTEIEEETTPELFEALWALTEGCRVQKRRYVVPDGDLTWEIDEFLDRELFLAEVELDDAATEVVLPAWLADHVERDVTGEARYVNLNLAR